MIKSWTIQNFKSVRDKTTLEMASLTIFAGANSSGKSTFIQSLLLTMQTLQSPVYSRSVILNGHIVRLGAFDDIVSNGNDSDQISIEFQLTPLYDVQRGLGSSLQRRYFSTSVARSLESIECHFSFSASGPAEEKEALQLQPRLEESGIKVSYKSTERPYSEEVLIRRSSKEISKRVEEYNLSDSHAQTASINSLEYEVVKPATVKDMARYYRMPGVARPVGASLLHFLPQRISVVYDEIERQSLLVVQSFILPEEFRYSAQYIDEPTVINDEFRKIILNALREVIEEVLPRSGVNRDRIVSAFDKLDNDFTAVNMRRLYASVPQSQRALLTQSLATKSDELQRSIRDDRPPEYTLEYIPLSEFSEAAVDYVQQFFTRSLRYLGPLRDEPKPVYPLAGATDPKDIGFRGENTAAVLEVYRKTKVTYIPSFQFSSGETQYKPKSSSLLDAVLDWLDYMGVASDVKTFDRGKLGHELKVAASGSDSLHDLTHVGVGVSQVLPILVLSLLADAGSTLIFEQPELHLHPRVQTRLADFFVSMTMLNKQCIVETHSEYLINRLRYRAAVSDGDQVSKDVIMYFVEKQIEYSNYRPVRINRFGVIEDWPKGFFDENEENAAAILKAAMNKRRKEAKK